MTLDWLVVSLRNVPQPPTLFWNLFLERGSQMREGTQQDDKTSTGFTRARFVMTQQDALLAMAKMTAKKPRAAALLNFLMSQMERGSDAIVINQKLIAKILSLSPRTIQYAITDLIEWNFIEVIRLHGPGAVAAYRINSNVAWVESRKDLCTAKFTATIVADFEDQPKDRKKTPLRKVPRLPDMPMPGDLLVDDEPKQRKPRKPRAKSQQNLFSEVAELEAHA
jgi:hypothetical protein